MLERLNKYLAECGICSRRKADEHILNGEVKINGIKALVGQKIDLEKDQVFFRGKKIKKIEGLVYYAVNKPRGIISSASDEKGRKNVTDLVPKIPRVYPVGRLDKESEGLIILTNDGELAQELSHPSNQHDKEYFVKVKMQKSKVKGEIQNYLRFLEHKLISGIKIDGVLMKMKSVKIEPLNSKFYILNTVLVTGHNRQIRKMCAKIGLDVVSLKRTRINNLKLDDLNIDPGDYKQILKSEIIATDIHS